MKNLLKISMLTLVLLVAISCKKDKEEETPAPTTGTINGTVTELGSSIALSDVKLTVYDSKTNAPTSYSATTNSVGKYSIVLTPGTYYLKLEKQGYLSIPSVSTTPITFTIIAGKNIDNTNFQLTKSSLTNIGILKGNVKKESTNIAGVLVVANNGTNGYSAISDLNGNYTIYNIPSGSYIVNAYKADYNSTETNASVTANSETINVNLTLTVGATGSVNGSVSFLATNNGEVDVALVNQYTKETIPGLSVRTSGGAYNISKVPTGKYILRASFENDSYVVDPDWILKNGEPFVDVNNSSIQKSFSVTGSVKLNSPTNIATSVVPVEVSASNLTYAWTAYSSTDEYVLEVSDINGNIIWGGFTKNGQSITKNVVVDKSKTSCTHNFDNSATQSLQIGQVYRWKVYASKSDNNDPNGWKLISASEDQQGLIKIIP